jgi:hypothetical protein
MSLYDITVPVYIKYLRNIDSWIEKAESHAQQKKFDPAVLLQARLAPDQFALVQQVQTACDSAKFGASKLAGKESPSHPDTEKTVDEIRARIRTVLSYLESFRREDFAGAEQRAVAHTWMQGKHMRGSDYVGEFALPNFFFHVTTAYAILRHNGVELGKMDFLGGLSLQG